MGSLDYEDLDNEKDLQKDVSDTSFRIARLLVDIGKHRDETSVANVIDRDRMQATTPAVSITKKVVKDTDKGSVAYKTLSDETERRTDVSDIPGDGHLISGYGFPRKNPFLRKLKLND